MYDRIRTYYLRKLVNTIVDSTLTSPSLAELVSHHLSGLGIGSRPLRFRRFTESSMSVKTI